MIKEGKYRAFRNIPVGWLLQAIHSTDLSERLFRIIFELIVYFSFWQACFKGHEYSVIYAFFLSHSVCWLLTGNFWVYMLDSFLFVRNPGVDKLIAYIKLTKKMLTYLNCCDAILIYGSMCRNMFHGRSDLDLRVIRRSDAKYGAIALAIGLACRAYAFFKIIPVDLQVVDSLNFLRQQMREDENPIIVYKRKEANLSIKGRVFQSVVRDPDSVIKKNA